MSRFEKKKQTSDKWDPPRKTNMVHPNITPFEKGKTWSSKPSFLKFHVEIFGDVAPNTSDMFHSKPLTLPKIANKKWAVLLFEAIWATNKKNKSDTFHYTGCLIGIRDPYHGLLYIPI